MIAFIRKRNKIDGEQKMNVNEKSAVEKMDTGETTKTVATTPAELPIEVDSQWVHMDKIEYEKLEWMKDLPQPSVQRTGDDTVSTIQFHNCYCIFT